ncbi:MAG: hypothetical protein WDO70_00255 [Alphaproteobacteria bacterium]
MSEIIDLTLTQAIERYMEMEPEAVHDAIVAEWPEQLAVILVEFFFKTTCGNCDGLPDFIQIPREQSDIYYIVPLCGCEWGGE